jgi:hypothetical protein
MTHPISIYLEIANLDDPAEQASRLAEVVDPDVTYTDAHAPDVIDGLGNLARFLTMFRDRVPNLRFEPLGQPDTFHHAYRQPWALKDSSSGTTFSAGVFTGTTNSDGRLDLILGFIDVEPR